MNSEGITKLEHQSDALRTLLIRVYAQFLFLRPMMVNFDLIARMGSEGRRAGFEQLRELLYRNFIQELVKVCEDKDPRTPSVRGIMEKVKDPKVKEILEDRYSKRTWPRVEGESFETWERLQADEEQSWRIKFQEVYTGLVQRADQLLSSKVLGSYKTVRDRLLAHNELRKTGDGYRFLDVGSLGLKYGQERETLELLKTVVDDINSVVRNASFTWSSFFEPETRDVCAFWQIESIEQDGP